MRYFQLIKKAYQNTFNFSGRASLGEIWSLFSFQAIIYAILLAVLSVSKQGTGAEIISIIWICVLVINAIPNLSCQVRRLHDVGRSGWYLLIGAVPIVNLWLMYMLYVEPSEFDGTIADC